MFYGRPKIEPLGWDLTALPEPSGSRNFEAYTADRRPVDFRFSSGWLTVERGTAGAAMDEPGMEEVLSLQIAPFGIMEIDPEQICDILGITVNGHKISTAGMRIGSRGFDWSGETTYWQSTHMMLSRDDAREFVQRLCEAFPGSILVQPEWDSHARLRCREIKFLMGTDEVVSLGIGWQPAQLQRLLAGEASWEDFETIFDYRIEFSREDRVGEDPTGARFVYDRGARDLGLKFDVIHHRRYRIRTEYPTFDPTAQARTKTLLSLIGENFCRSLEMVNLQTGAVVTEKMADDEDERSYSTALRDEFLAKPERYFYVGMTLRDNPLTPGVSIFYGVRPPRRVA